MISNYKLIVVSEASEDIAKKTLEAVKKLLDGKGAKVTDEASWGKKTLAYTIKKQNEGTYNILKFHVEGKEVSELDSKLRMTNGILRHLIIREEVKTEKAAKVSTSKKKKGK